MRPYYGTTDAAGGPVAGTVIDFGGESEIQVNTSDQGLAWVQVVCNGFNPGASNLLILKVFGRVTSSDEWILLETPQYDDNYTTTGAQQVFGMAVPSAPYMRFELFGQNGALGSKLVEVYVIA